jgi:hypothetical protein
VFVRLPVERRKLSRVIPGKRKRDPVSESLRSILFKEFQPRGRASPIPDLRFATSGRTLLSRL